MLPIFETKVSSIRANRHQAVSSKSQILNGCEGLFEGRLDEYATVNFNLATGDKLAIKTHVTSWMIGVNATPYKMELSNEISKKKPANIVQKTVWISLKRLRPYSFLWSKRNETGSEGCGKRILKIWKQKICSPLWITFQNNPRKFSKWNEVQLKSHCVIH